MKTTEITPGLGCAEVHRLDADPAKQVYRFIYKLDWRHFTFRGVQGGPGTLSPRQFAVRIGKAGYLDGELERNETAKRWTFVIYRDPTDSTKGTDRLAVDDIDGIKMRDFPRNTNQPTPGPRPIGEENPFGDEPSIGS